MENRFTRELALFDQALLLDRSARRAFLDEATAGDVNLRSRVDALLAAHERGAGFLESPADGVQTALAETENATFNVTEKSGDRIGRYKLLQQIGEGGCGIVYMAEQQAPVRRRVALKVIKLGMDSRSVIARFEAERQALALMDHPNIAKVFDAGTTESGRPFFVMELVRGVRLTDFCDEAKLDLRERLDLFVQVCGAIQHAHQKGIIHRDIKPSNILVTVNDGVPVPKVIDFGIAKATNQQQLTDKTLFTAFEQFIGTPAYMSPEQAALTSLDIDTRSDIYALGVLLYELVTGRTPFDAQELMRAGLDEIRRTIREVEPPRPSTRVSTIAGPALTAIAAQRQLDPSKLATTIRRELDWLVMKCLEKDRNRRYETANGLAADVRRYLANEPITARPPSTAYRLEKLIRRNKLAFAAGAAVLGALVFGLVASTWHAVRASRAQRAALAAKLDAEKARAAETSLRQAADEARELAVRSEQTAHRYLYAADLHLARRALTEGNLGRAAELIEKHAPTNYLAQPPSAMWEWRHLWGEVRSDELLQLPGSGHAVPAAFFSRDGSTILTGCDDKIVRIFKYPSLELAASFTNVAGVRGVAMPRRGSWLALSGHQGFVTIWDPVKQTARTFSNDTATVKLALTPDDRTLIMASFRSVALWDLEQDRLLQRIPIAHRNWPGPGLAISPDGSRVAFSTERGGSALLNIRSSETNALDHPDTNEVLALAFSPDGRLLASAGMDRVIKIRETASGRIVSQLRGHAAFVADLKFSHNGLWLASCGADQTIRVYRAPDWAEARVLRGHRREVWSVDFSPDDTLLVSAGSSDGTARVWPIQISQEPPNLVPLTNDVVLADLSVDGAHAILAYPKGWATLDCQTGVKTARQPFTNGPPIINATLADGGRAISFGDMRGGLWFSTNAGQTFTSLSSTGRPINNLGLSGRAETLALSRSDRSLEVWDPRAKTRLLTLTPNGQRDVRSIDLSRRGDKLIAGDYEGGVRVYDLSNGAIVADFFEHRWMVNAVAICSETGTAVTACSDGKLKLYDLPRAAVRATVEPDQFSILSCLAFSPDGLRLAGGSTEGTVVLWDLTEPVPLEMDRLKIPQGAVLDLAFSMDGERLLAAAAGVQYFFDFTAIHIWRAPAWREIHEHTRRHTSLVHNLP